jgi:hypothetical protein
LLANDEARRMAAKVSQAAGGAVALVEGPARDSGMAAGAFCGIIAMTHRHWVWHDPRRLKSSF